MSSSAAEPAQDAAGLACPSSRCEPGATLLGVIEVDGTVGYITPRLTIDEDFVERARRGRKPESRFRFSGPCVEAGCRQWTGSRCGLIDRVLDAGLEHPHPEAERGGLPQCSIRSSCRWFDQAGAEACRVCPLVITDTA